MEAAQLKKVPDNLNRGTSFLPSAGNTGDDVCYIPTGTAGSGPAPTAAPNSGKKLDSSFLSPSNSVSNGQGRQYDGSPDNDPDDAPLSSKGAASNAGEYPLPAATSKL